MRLAPLAAAAAAALVAAAPVGAEPATSAQVRALARRALSDPAALAALRRVDRVDGRPVALRSALTRTSKTALESRLRTLAAGSPRPAAVGSTDARGRAAAILRERRFGDPLGAPHPFRRLLRWLGGIVQPVTDAVGRAFDWVAGWLPGGRPATWLLLALAVALVASRIAVGAGQRRAGRALGLAPSGSSDERDDPRRLEREAGAALERGDFDRAVRLLFRAGLIRVARAGAIPARESLTSGDVARRLRSPRFDRLNSTFESVAYGGGHASREAAEGARTEWRSLLGELGA